MRVATPPESRHAASRIFAARLSADTGRGEMRAVAARSQSRVVRPRLRQAHALVAASGKLVVAVGLRQTDRQAGGNKCVAALPARSRSRGGASDDEIRLPPPPLLVSVHEQVYESHVDGVSCRCNSNDILLIQPIRARPRSLLPAAAASELACRQPPAASRVEQRARTRTLGIGIGNGI